MRFSDGRGREESGREGEGVGEEVLVVMEIRGDGGSGGRRGRSFFFF